MEVSWCNDSCTAVFAWRVWQVYSLPCWCQSLQAACCWLGAVRTWSYLQTLEVSGPLVLASSVILFAYPAGSEDALIAGRLLMRFCNVSFAEKNPLGDCPRKERLLNYYVVMLLAIGLLIVVLMDQDRIFSQEGSTHKEHTCLRHRVFGQGAANHQQMEETT